MYTYEELKTFVNHCRRCPLSETRNKAVMGQGNMASKMLFVAEAPGSSEDRADIPFTGPSGHVFDELLAGIGMTRKDIYLTNIVKCHPPGNRDRRPEEQEACINYLKYETYLTKPKLLFVLAELQLKELLSLIIELRGHMVLSYIERALG